MVFTLKSMSELKDCDARNPLTGLALDGPVARVPAVPAPLAPEPLAKSRTAHNAGDEDAEGHEGDAEGVDDEGLVDKLGVLVADGLHHDVVVGVKVAGAVGKGRLGFDFISLYRFFYLHIISKGQMYT